MLRKGNEMKMHKVLTTLKTFVNLQDIDWKQLFNIKIAKNNPKYEIIKECWIFTKLSMYF